MPRAVGVSPWSLSKWPRSCSRAAVTSAASAPASSAEWAVCNACSSWVTGSPAYMRPPRRSNSERMPGSVSATIRSVAMRAALPWQRIRLHIGKAFHRFLHAFLVSEPGIFDASERGKFETVAGHLAHVDAADIELGHQARDVVEPVRAHRRRQSVVGRIGDRDRLVRSEEHT